MTAEQQLFLNLLADHLNGRPTEPAADIDWQVMAKLAKSHQVEGIVYAQCRNHLPPETEARFAQTYAGNIYYYQNRVSLMNHMAERFEQEGIPYYTVKGMTISALYPTPALRTMGDCDIVVHAADRERVHAALLDMGYTNTEKGDMEWIYFKNSLEFEIHHDLLYDSFVNSVESREAMGAAWDHVLPTDTPMHGELDWNFHFIYLLLHLKKHLINHGIGFRQFMDIALVMQKKDLDYAYITDMLQKLDMMTFFETCVSFCARWFAVELPYARPLEEKAFETWTDIIFQNGVFGFDNEDHRKNASLNVVRKYGRFGAAWLNFFPSYAMLRRNPAYSFVNGKPWLVPAAWVYRAFRGVFGGKSKEMRSLVSTAVTTDREKLDARDEALRQWGL